MLFSAILSLLFFICVLAYEFKKMRKAKAIRIINVFGIMYAIVYGLLNSIYSFAYEFNGLEFSRIHYDNDSRNAMLAWIIWSILGYILIRFVYVAVSNKRKDQVSYSNPAVYENKPIMCYRLQITSLICLFIGVVSLYLWSMAYGGIINFISVAGQVRSGIYNVHNSLAFFKHPARTVLIVSYFSIKLIKEGYHKFVNGILFLVSFVCSMLFLFAADGRMNMGIYFVIIFLISLDALQENINIRKKAKTILFIGIIALLIIMSMDDISFYLRYHEWDAKSPSSTDSLVNNLLTEFTFIPASGQLAVKTWYKQGSPFLIFHDLLSGIFSWLPSSFKPFALIDIWDYNTALYKQGTVSLGQLPCDYITTSIYDMGLLGIFFFAIFWGYIMKRIDLLKKRDCSPFVEVSYYVLMTSFLRMVEYCMLSDFLLGLFYLFAAYVVWRCSAILVQKKMKRSLL